MNIDMPRIINKSYKTLYVVISTGRAKELLGTNLTVEKLDEMSDEEIEAYYNIYELNYTCLLYTSPSPRD